MLGIIEMLGALILTLEEPVGLHLLERGRLGARVGLVRRAILRVVGRVRSMRVQPWSGVQALECTLVDGSGAINIVFLGRRTVAGLEVGAKLTAEGMVGKHDGRLAIINPSYELLTPSAQAKPAVS